MWGGYLYRMASEAARVACFPKALFTGRNEAGRDGIAHNLFLKHKLLGRVLWQGLHIADDSAILALSACIPMEFASANALKCHTSHAGQRLCFLMMAPQAEKCVTLRTAATQQDIGQAVKTLCTPDCFLCR